MTLRAKVVTAFPGVEDGKIYGRVIQIGEEISGDLAEAAVRDKFATKLSGDAPAETAKSKDVDTTGKSKETTTTEKVKPDIEIPSDWKTMKTAQLVELAAKIKKADVADAGEAKTVIEGELARRG